MSSQIATTQTRRLFRLFLSGLLVVAAVGLVAAEQRIPGFCPTYPFLDVPACYVLGIVFFWMFAANFLESQKTQHLMMQVSGFIALASSSFFSTQQFLGTGYCPEIFSIPLCYTVPPLVVAIMYLQVVEQPQQSHV